MKNSLVNDKQLQQYFMEFQKIQDIHMGSYAHENSDLETMIFERKRAFENLRNAISMVSASVLKTFKQNSDAILEQDRIFMAKLEESKKELLKKIHQRAKGRRVLKGYCTKSTQSLRFMNTKG